MVKLEQPNAGEQEVTMVYQKSKASLAVEKKASNLGPQYIVVDEISTPMLAFKNPQVLMKSAAVVSPASIRENPDSCVKKEPARSPVKVKNEAAETPVKVEKLEPPLSAVVKSEHEEPERILSSRPKLTLKNDRDLLAPAIKGEKPYPRVFECVLCNFRFSSVEVFEKHKREIHPDLEWASPAKNKPARAQKETSPCSHCGKWISRKSLKRHIKVMHLPRGPPPERVHPCPVCPAKFTVKSSIPRHMRAMHGAKFECAECGIDFRTDFNLRAHIYQGHQSREFKPLPPPDLKLPHRFILPKVPQDGAAIGQAVAMAKAETPFEDENLEPGENSCDNLTLTPDSNDGVANDGDEISVGETVACPFCGVATNTMDELCEHLREVHDIKSLMTCTACGAGLPDVISLEKHWEDTHKDVSEFAESDNAKVSPVMIDAEREVPELIELDDDDDEEEVKILEHFDKNGIVTGEESSPVEEEEDDEEEPKVMVLEIKPVDEEVLQQEPKEKAVEHMVIDCSDDNVEENKENDKATLQCGKCGTRMPSAEMLTKHSKMFHDSKNFM